jgi:hypothetical protein
MALTRIRVLNQQSTYNVDRLNANTLVVGGNNITGASGAGGGIVISSVVYLAANGTPLIANAAPTTGNSVIKIIGSGFAANANVFLNGLLQPSANVTFVDSTELRLNMPPLASNTYSLYTFNAAGAGAIFYSGVRFDPYPIWTTGTYSATGNVSTQLLVTGYGSGSITFSLASGNTLPSGLSLAANGLITGTTTANTYSFYVNAIDSENEITTQQISLTVSFPDTYFPYTTLLLSADSQTANNVSTETFTDSSNNNFAVTSTGTPYQGSFSPFPTTGTWSNYFDGTDDYFTIPNSSNFDFPGNFTVELWFNFTSTPAAAAQTFVSNYKTGGSMGWALQFRGESNNVFRFGYGNTTILDSTTQTIIGKVWYHLAVTRTASTITLFLNGVSIGSTTNATSFESDQEVWVGGLTNIGQYFPGYISNLRVVKGTAVYTSAFTPPTTPLTAITNTSLLTCQANRFIDNSTNAFTVTPVSTTKVQRFNPFGSNGLSYSPSTNGGSIYFDGSSYLTMASNSSFAFGTGDFTVEGWIYPTSLPNYCTICSTRTSGGTSAGWNIGVSSSGQLFLYAENFKVNPGQGGLGGVLVNTWTHFAIVRSGTALKAYINGIQNGATGSDSNDYTIQTFWTGITGGTSEPWYGYISNLRILKGTALYTSTFTPPTVPFVPITNTSLLLLGSNSKFLDSTKINNIKNVGGVAVRTDIKNYGTNSWYFDGSSYLTMLNNPIFNFPKDFTIELWLYNVSTVFYGNIFSTTANYVTANGLRLTTGPSNNTFSVGIGNSGSVTGNTTFSNNTWVHVALVRSGTSLTIYQNGINIGTGTESTAFISDTMVIGTVSAAGGGAGGPYNLNGYIQDFRVTNGIARYTTTFTPPTSPVSTT